ncbi:hypothetical protein GCM10022245_34940 [Streptomyces mayteni]
MARCEDASIVRRIWGIVLAALLLGGVAVALVQGRDDGGTATTTVRGVIGSEKAEFFTDPEVIEVLAERGYEVRTESVGSWAMDGVDMAGYDFAFPSSQAPAQELAARAESPGAPLRPFYSPLVVLARGAAAEVLAAEGIVTLADEHQGLLSMGAYLEAVGDGRAWGDLAGADPQDGLAGTLYVSSTDPLTSNSGALYLAAASYVENDGTVVADAEGVERVAPLLRTLVQVQGTQQPSSDGPFRDFVSGIGNPLVLAYESQIGSLLMAGQDPGDVVVLYPDTTVSSDHTLVPLSDEGRELGQLLTDDPELRRLAVRHGFRPQGATAEFTEAAGEHAAYLDAGLAGVRQAPPPTTDVLRQLAERATGRSEGS